MASEVEVLRSDIKRVVRHYRQQAARLKHVESRDALRRIANDFENLAIKPRLKRGEASGPCVLCGLPQGEHVVPDVKGKKIPVLLCPQFITVRGFLSVYTPKAKES